jgi:hypothetical protein
MEQQSHRHAFQSNPSFPNCFYRESRGGNLDARLKYSGVTHQAN